MEVSKDKLNEYINLYLNDVEDYGDNRDYYLLSETVLNNLKKPLITENKINIKQLILENHNKNSIKQNDVLDDFLQYIENI